MAKPRPGDYVMVAVTDTGSGMTAEVASRAFEPFFTTKEVGKGTGLGLSMVYGFAQQSGGSMQIRSEPGQGTAVKLFFPRVAHAADERRAARRSDRHACRQRDHSRRRGRRHGSGVCRKRTEGARLSRHRDAATRPAALEILREPGEIDLLFTDVVMPGGMFGPELAEQGVGLRPALKILFTSGYSRNPVEALDGLGHEVRILNKPYRRHDLASMLRSALEGTERASSFPYQARVYRLSGPATSRKATTRFATNSTASMTKIRSIGPFSTDQ